MRIAFLGSGEFGLPTLRALAGRHDVAGVFTQPARPAGRGGKLRPTPVHELADELGLPVAEMEDVNSGANVFVLSRLNAEAIVVVDFGQMIGPDVLAATRLGAYNLHGSLLPALRGAAPVNWAILRGCKTTGVTAFRVVKRMDAGDIFVQRETPISIDETAEELRARLSELGVETVLETIELLAAGRTAGRPQDESQATKAPKLSKADGRIEFAAPAEEVRNRIHGCWPWPGGQARYVGADGSTTSGSPPSGKTADVILARARAHETDADAPPGTVLDDLAVATGRGRLEIVEIKPAGGRRMGWRDFVNGHRVKPGARLEAPPQ